MALRLRLVLALLVVLLSVPSSAAAQQRQVYWGAIVDGTAYGYGTTPTDWRGITTFEQHAGKAPAIISFGNSWQWGGTMTPFYAAPFQAIRDHGSIPLFTWQSKGDNWSDFTNAQILSGRYDSYIRQWATAAGAWGHPFFLRFDHEMDGGWYPWGEGHVYPGGPIVNGNTPGSYVRMWRHVHDLFAEVGAYNVTWVWTVNHECVCPGKYAPLSQVFPGENYVNWTGIDAYNRFPGQWLTFSQMLVGGTQGIGDTYHAVLRVAPNRPMMLPEFGSKEGAPGQKAAWLRDAFQAQIPQNFPAIKAVVYYNWGSGGLTIPIESSASAQAAFAAGVQSPVYLSNTFGDLGYARILN